MMRWKGIIFDLDGVLVHTDRMHYQAWKQLADRLGIEFNESINHRLRGVSRMESLELILQHSDQSFSIEEKERFAEEKNRCYAELLGSLTPEDVEKEVTDTLRILRERGALLAVGSSSKNAGYILEKTALAGYFDAVVDGNLICKSKPDPEVFLKAAEMLELAPQECLVVEDAPSGIQAAKSGRMQVAGIGEAAGDRDTDYPICSLGELVELVK